MLGKLVSVCGGLLLLLFGAYLCLKSFQSANTYLPQKQAKAAVPTSSAVSPNETALGPELGDVARVKSYGPLASVTEQINSSDTALAIPGDDNKDTSKPQSPPSASTLFDHVAGTATPAAEAPATA